MLTDAGLILISIYSAGCFRSYIGSQINHVKCRTNVKRVNLQQTTLTVHMHATVHCYFTVAVTTVVIGFTASLS